MNFEIAKTFEFENKKYDVVVFNENGNVKVIVFSGNKRANGYSYSADLFVRMGFSKQFGSDPKDLLIEDAVRDVEEKNWEKYCAAYEKLYRKN